MEDSRFAWKLLVGKCEGHNATNRQLFLATRVVSISPNGGGVFYRNEYQFSFEKYRTKLQEAYSTLACYHNVVPAQFHLQRMLYGMQV